jgi:DNA primase
MENGLLFGVIREILGEPKKRNESKGQYSFDCPVCSANKGKYEGDNKGNLEVNLNKSMFNCWACGETHNTHGSLNKLILKFGTKHQIKKLKVIGIDIKERKSKKTTLNKVNQTLELPPNVIYFESGNPKDIEYKRAWNYLTKERKLSPETIFKFKMGYIGDGKYSGRIFLPSFDDTGTLNYWVTRTYNNQKPKYLNPDFNKEEIIFNECCLNWDSTIYLVEGPFDHLVIHNSIPMLGKKLSDKLLNTLFNKSTSDIVILMDSDAWLDTKMLFNKINVGKLHGRIKTIKLLDDYDIAKIHEDFGREGVIGVMRNSFKIKESDL